MTSTSRTFLVAAAVLAATVGFGAVVAQRPTGRNLPNPDSSNFKDLGQITKANVAKLEVAWFYPYDAAIFSPVYARDVLYGLRPERHVASSRSTRRPARRSGSTKG